MRWTSRKFWSMIAFEALFFYMRKENLITVEVFSNLTQTLIFAYFVANAGISVADKVRSAIAEKVLKNNNRLSDTE